MTFRKKALRSQFAVAGSGSKLSRRTRSSWGVVGGALLLAQGCWSQLKELPTKKDAGANDSADSNDSTSLPAEAGANSLDGSSCQTCGGADCPLCALGQECRRNADCESKVCNGTCLPAGCGNDVQDEGETDIDCGGSCDPCGDGKQCKQDPHCTSNVCTDGYCQTPSCTDKTENGTESDVDCGGKCDPCKDGLECETDDDCTSGFCGNGTCADPSCGDSTINGEETDLNCGGEQCPRCTEGKLCRVANDCQSGLCEPNDSDELVCAPSACDDEVMNGNETDLDCGGDKCDPCVDGKLCLVGTDCESAVCAAESDLLTCIPPSCNDSRQNGTETDVDCGGDDNTCSRCPVGLGCAKHEDCETNSCADEECQAASCEDGRLNQTEIEVDCGGDDCDGCPLGAACNVAGDCRSDNCDETCLPGGAAAPCDENDECLSDACRSNECQLSEVGQGCAANSDCASNRCDDSSNVCLASQYVIETEGLASGDQQVTFRVWVERGDTDPTRSWGDFAMLYYFTPPPQSGKYDFVSKYYSGPDRDDRNLLFLAREVSGGEWLMIWRVHDDNATVIPTTTPTSVIELQLHGKSSINFNDNSDHSYAGPSRVANPNVVICQRIDGQWFHTQGQAPDFAPNPCAQIVDSCPSSGTLACDVLERTD